MGPRITIRTACSSSLVGLHQEAYYALVSSSSPQAPPEALDETHIKHHQAYSLVTQSRLVFAFTGQGTQWPQMGRQLIKNLPSFRKSIDDTDEAMMSLPDGPDWGTLTGRLLAPAATPRINDAQTSQACCAALQIALVDQLRTYNIKPTCVLGHSSGEMAAAYACGALSQRDAIIVAYHRGKVLADVDVSGGGMAAIGLGVDEIASHP